MRGVINRGIQDFVLGTFGQETWDAVRELAMCEEPFFSTSEDYPDEMTLALVQAAADTTGLDRDTVLFEFGKYWFPHTGVATYPALSRLVGRSAREFLLNVDRLHRRVIRIAPGTRPPIVACEELPDGRLRIHYRSERGLCDMLRGLIEGVGIHFNETLQVEKASCIQDGDAECVVEVGFSCPQTTG